jgi:hypothetical protein
MSLERGAVDICIIIDTHETAKVELHAQAIRYPNGAL